MDNSSPDQFWNDIYQNGARGSSGKPGLLLAQFAAPLRPGRALELGCAKGDDAVWLASEGWQVTAVDISSVALELAAGNAARKRVADRIVFERHDLSLSFPEGRFDLVTASFLHSPHDWPRSDVLARAAAAVAPMGHLLIVEHGTRAPWSWSPEGTRFPTAEDTLAEMRLQPDAWQRLCICRIAREARGPEGQTARVEDNVIFLQRGDG
ncbi:class I SAM-dependent methyltransferase [Rhodobacter sp. NTK016B]|uniref:class I SAM-dependent methyltransferase n=1 Tax=Rhodobacter sp. NTK016B TaxID=2759676 RepID=UPI001A8CF722|nr:class I SAM-dependent methyltransferase [Rhodobacter sp. NTK016B]MBN8291817.1 class I SAM-dependent methyltransferase [Rhodobacter sp. NTK016B]